MIMLIIGVLLVLWVLGLLVNIGGGLVHILIVAAILIFIWNLVTGRRKV